MMEVLTFAVGMLIGGTIGIILAAILVACKDE